MTKRIRSKRERDPVTKKFLPYRNPDDVAEIKRLTANVGFLKAITDDLEKCNGQQAEEIEKLRAHLEGSDARVKEVEKFASEAGLGMARAEEALSKAHQEAIVLKEILIEIGRGFWFCIFAGPGLAHRIRCAIRGDGRVSEVSGAAIGDHPGSP